MEDTIELRKETSQGQTTEEDNNNIYEAITRTPISLRLRMHSIPIVESGSGEGEYNCYRPPVQIEAPARTMNEALTLTRNSAHARHRNLPVALPLAYAVSDNNSNNDFASFHGSSINTDSEESPPPPNTHTRPMDTNKEIQNKLESRKKVAAFSCAIYLIVATVFAVFQTTIHRTNEHENPSATKTINNETDSLFVSNNTFSQPTLDPVQPNTFYNSSSAVDDIVSQPVSEPINNTDSTATSSQNAQEQQIEKNFTTCFTDPVVVQSLEWEAYERGDDPSVPRTYHFCPNSQINVFGFSPYIYKMDYTTGDAFPLILFRPNVNILCGEDGDYSNNCTFSGGFFHIGLNERPIFVDYDINSTTENITISGFRFTGASGGVNIVSRSRGSSLTVKNCRFDNNKDMSATINLTGGKMVKSRKLFVYNSTFDNNSYTYNNYEGSTGLHVPNPHVGVILSYPLSTSSDTRIDIHVSSCVFLNNSFNDIHDITGAIINLFPPVTKLEVTQSCFIGNSGYTSAIMLLGKRTGEEGDDKKGDSSSSSYVHESYCGNHFSENLPSELNNGLSCNLNYLETSLMYYPFGAVSPREGCGNYIDSEIRETNDDCFILE